MSFDVNAIVPINFAPNIGAKPNAMPIKLCTRLDEQQGPRAMRVDIPWTEEPYSASYSRRNVSVKLDLRSLSVSGGGAPLDAIRFCKIDNTYNDVTVYARFGDTQDVILCPPNSIVGVPVQSANQDVTLYGTDFFTGRAPVTSYFFSNAPQEPYFVQDAGRFSVVGGMTDINMAVPVGQPTFNFGCELGPPADDRILIVSAYCRRVAVLNNQITNIRINGVNLTTFINQSFFDGARVYNAAWGYLRIPTSYGTFGSLDLVYANNQDMFSFTAWVVNRYTRSTPYFTVIDQISLAGAPVSLPTDAIPGAFCMWNVFGNTALANQALFYGPKSIYSVGAQGTGTLFTQAYSANALEAAPLALVRDGYYGSGVTWI